MKRPDITPLDLVDTRDLLDEIAKRFDNFVFIADMESAVSPDDGGPRRFYEHTENSTMAAYGLVLWCARRLRRELDEDDDA